MFSALVLTHNEEQLIEGCLRSLTPAERIVVIDSGSTDRTVDLATSFAAVQLVTRVFRSFADQRNYGLDNCFPAGEWVLHIDADERLTTELAEELRSLGDQEGRTAYNIASRTFVRGRPVLRAAGFPVYQTRLTRAGYFRFEQVGHGQKAPLSHGPLPRLMQAYDHHPFEKGMAAWRKKHEKYAQEEAAALTSSESVLSLRSALDDPILLRRYLNRATARLTLRPVLVWLYLLVIRGGVLDGRAGWEYCRLRRLYEQLVVARSRALGRAPRAR
jgi:glycosyltransferase involved in cell wall biosynthesis